MRKKILLLIGIILIISLFILNYYNLLYNKVYSMESFHIKRVLSDIDYDQDGIDDYTDILLGAREYVSSKPIYKSAYYQGGYPPINEGVCTDVIWYALKKAGYSLKDMIDEDIKNNILDYPRVNGKIDSNIDFRRVANLKVFFKKYTLSLTNDLDNLSSWQPGDIVIFEHHIGIISDKRNKNGYPYLIHQSTRPLKEEDAISKYKIIGHYRFKLNNV